MDAILMALPKLWQNSNRIQQPLWDDKSNLQTLYSKAFFEAHREEITLHKAAKDAFQKMGVSKLPKVKELSEEYASVLEQKKSLYAQYRLSREEMREYQKALHNTEVFFDMDRNSEKDARTQSEVDQKNQPAK